MKKFVFAIASVTSLAGFIAAVGTSGCTSSEDPASPPPDGGTPDVTKPPTKGPPDEGDAETPPQTCMANGEVDVSSVAYKSPSVTAGACDPGTIDVIEQIVKDKPNATYEDLKTALAQENDACAKCVFGPDGDTWAPIVEDADEIVALNVGGCVELASGKSDCGKAYQQWDACLEEACKSCSDDDVDTCTQDAQQSGAACGKASEALATACGANVNDYIGSCYKAGQLVIEGPIKAQCIGSTIKDAGTD